MKLQMTRLFEITYILLNKKSVTAKELAQQFGVSTRTIRRDVDSLSLAGIPVYTRKGKNGGISLMPDFVLNKSILSEQEQNEILTALHGLSMVKTDDAKGVLARLSTIFNKTATNWLEVDFSDWDYNDEFNDFTTAILGCQVVEFDYYNSYGDKTFRRVEPMQLSFKYKAWYLKAFCLTKQGMRLYKLTRVRNLAVTQEQFLPRDVQSAEADNDSHHADAHTGITLPIDTRENITIPVDTRENITIPADTRKNIAIPADTRKNITIKLRIAPDATYRVFDDFGEDMIEKQPDGSFIVTRTYPEDNWVYSYVLSFGEHAQVLEPEHLREIIKTKAKNILELYF